MREGHRGHTIVVMEVRSRFERWPPWVTDTILAAVLAVLSVVSIATISTDELALYGRNPDALAYALALVQTVPLALRRIYPVPILVVVVVGFLFDRALDYPSTIATIGFAFAFHSLGSQLPRRRSLVIGLPVIAFLTLFTISGVLSTDSVTWATVFIVALVTAAPLMLGREVYERRRYVSELEARTEHLERDRLERAERAVREERSRIARELHDVVAHEMTVMTVQAAAARRVLGKRPTEAAEALVAIESAGHQALTEMRRLLGVLRTADAAGDLAPQPGIERLGILVEQMRDAGLAVDLTITGLARGVPAGIDVNAFRIVQEALTNTLKHGGPQARATVRLAFGSDQLSIEVEDDGRGAAEALSDTNGTGQGLVGMRERVALLHGELTAGPRAGGGYRVRARLPIGTP
jgi:signal transduction histidine kinase